MGEFDEHLCYIQKYDNSDNQLESQLDTAAVETIQSCIFTCIISGPSGF